ncbi:response regulator [Photobacterium kagoshimensis]|uniref:response regulator n=1 Tax=Photobacterium kagoshimensis TaxID=2910242 RepID=UPI003D138A84
MKRFMIIEDNKIMAQILTQLLRKCAKPQSIIHAVSPQSAVNGLINNTVDCVFLDLNLEKPLDGIPILQFIKKQHPSLPVVIVSGDSEMDTVKQVISLKPADYIVKPLSIQKLERCLSKVLPVANPS